jgi:uncharacterized protein (TIGR00725 family)
MSDAARPWVAVLGGAGRYDTAQLHAAYECGLELARQGCNVITGATTGVPHAAAFGAKDGGALVVGISPATCASEHVIKYGKPIVPADLVIYSGLAIDGRGPLILRSAQAAIFIGGEMGTLAEFAAGWLCGCPCLGLLESSGGVAANLRHIASSMTNWGSVVIAADRPDELVRNVCAHLEATPQPDWRDHEEATAADVLRSIREIRQC